MQAIRRVAGVRRAGHTGTLDPFATGVLVVCLGRATALAAHLTDADKAYRAVGRLGVVTDTGDRTGRVVGGSPPDADSARRLEEALPRFRGEFEQVPPAFSAKKIGGVRSYELARRGEDVPRRPVPVRVDRLDLVAWDGDRFTLEIRCAKGTYVRSLVQDLGEAAGCGATTEELVRTASGPFTLAQAVPLAALADAAAVERRLVPLADALPDWPALALGPDGLAAVGHGRAVGPPGFISEPPALPPGTNVRLVDASTGELLALARWSPTGDPLAFPFRVFVSTP